MNAKEKAIVLVANYVILGVGLEHYEAKQCALIAVDEILELIGREIMMYNKYEFYKKVKDEINKL